ncbi:MAG TPA: lysophospholipid acyltransferase family protein [Chryseosolibacter sp.]|nr:lysophospholipid acyltransferase family protein [Chryseosolibacter sp.]
MKFFNRLYTFYGVIIFFILFVIFFFLLLIPVVFPKKFRLVGVFNRWWAKLMFILIAIPFKVVYKEKLNPKRQYIFCPNHCSYLDIPTLALNKHNTVFVGKNDMENIPFFGFMYRKLHITVDRAKLKSRYITLVKSLKAIDQGKSLVIFPEGGIVSKYPPAMGEFKDGAFRAAIEKQIPIVPVTIPFNWIILPSDQFLLHWKGLKVIFHEPIDPSIYTLKELHLLKAKVKGIIENELYSHISKHEN